MSNISLYGRLRLKLGSDRRENLPKRVSDDSRNFIFRRRKNFFRKIFGSKKLFFANFARFRTTHSEMDVTISSGVRFCFRCAYSEVCVTKIPLHPVPYRPPAHVLRGNEDMSWLGHTRCLGSNTGDLVIRTKEIFWFEHRKSLDSNTGNLLIRTQEISWFEHKKSFDSNTGNHLIRTNEISWFEHRKSFDSNTRLLIRTHEIFWFEHKIFFPPHFVSTR